VSDRRVITLLEAVTIVSANITRDVRVTIFIAIVYIPDAVILVVAFSSLQAIKIAAALKVAKLSRRRIPTAPTPVLHRWRRRWRSILRYRRYNKHKRQQRSCDTTGEFCVHDKFLSGLAPTRARMQPVYRRTVFRTVS
jgi:hypothetical protein